MFWFCLGATATKLRSSDWEEYIEEIIQQYYGNLLETLEWFVMDNESRILIRIAALYFLAGAMAMYAVFTILG